jgi:hypothetical protein
VSEWHQSKLQQQQDAALVQEQQLAREQQMLNTLAAMTDAAHAAHEQVGEASEPTGLSQSLAFALCLIFSRQLCCSKCTAASSALGIGFADAPRGQFDLV